MFAAAGIPWPGYPGSFAAQEWKNRTLVDHEQFDV